jgi:putative spermidine/putrescine transport system substrate-binding protein
MEHHRFSRRQIMGGGAALVGAPFLGAGRAHAAGSIIAAAFPSSWEDAYRSIVAPLVKQRGTELVVSPALAQDQLAKLLASQGKPAFDAVMMSPGQTTEAVARGLIEKVDPSKIPNWAKLAPSAQTEWGPNVTVEITGIAYNPTVVPKPKTYRELFENQAYQGKVAWLGFGSNTATLAWVEVAKAFGGSEDNLEPAFRMLSQSLSKVGAIANNGNQQMTLFQQGEVAVFMASTGNVARLKSLGVPCEFAHPTTGSPALPVALHLAKGSSNPEGVYQYMDAVISAEAQTKLALPPTEMIPTNVDVPLTPSIKNYVSDADLKNLIYPNWTKINPNRAAWTAEFDRIVKK